MLASKDITCAPSPFSPLPRKTETNLPQGVDHVRVGHAHVAICARCVARDQRLEREDSVTGRSEKR